MQESIPYKAIKWLILLSAYGFLGYTLIRFDQYGEVWTAWKSAWVQHSAYLFLVFGLLPINWLLETKKWQFLIRNVQKLSLKKAFKSVMIGNTAAFFTPNRIGEFPGRSIALEKGKKLQGISVGILGAISQTLTIMLFGIPAACIFFTHKSGNLMDKENYILLSLSIFLVLITLYFGLPQISLTLKRFRFLHRIEHLLESLSQFSRLDLSGVLVLSGARYLVFCSQFYFLLLFFGVNISLVSGLIAIATNYLFITFTPSLAFSEGAIRSSIAILVIGIYSSNLLGIAAAGLSVWLINFVLPMTIGSVVLGKK